VQSGFDQPAIAIIVGIKSADAGVLFEEKDVFVESG